jgi:hypothetical protein
MAGMIRALLPLLALVAAAPALGQDPVDRLTDIGALARFRDSARVGMFSSYDRTGNNDDGFSGAHSFLRKEGDGLVVAELKGPGALTRIWTPTPLEAPIEFYVDGEKTPRLALAFSALFSGTQEPFTGPLVGRGLGGYWSYIPIAFARSIKVVVRAPRVQFHQINYVLFAPGTRIASFAQGDPPPSLGTPPIGRMIEASGELASGQALTLFETDRPGRIVSLKLGPASALAGPARDIDLRITWDGAARPAIEMPAGDLFGYSFGEPSARGLLLGSDGEWAYLKLPMPFTRGARVELVSRRGSGPAVPVRAELAVSDRGRDPDEGWLHAAWRREAPTTIGRPFRMLDVTGRGHLVGFTLQGQGTEPGNTGFFEGDDQVEIDGRLAIHGTGTEDMFNGGWYGLPGRWNGRGSLPFSGALDYSRQRGLSAGYRLLIGDAYSFSRSLRFDVEHGPERNADRTDYTGVTLFYLDRPEGAGSAPPTPAERTVVAPTGFRLGIFPFVGLDTLIDARLQPGHRKIGTDDVSFVRFERDTGASRPAPPPAEETAFADTFGPPALVLRAEAPQDGRYEVFVEALKGPNAAKLELRAADRPVAPAVDFYASADARSGPVSLGIVALKQGQNELHLAIPGRNPAAAGSGVDLLAIEGRLVR